MNIDFKQPSTQRGLIWLVFGIAGFFGWWSGKDISQLIPFIGAIAAGAHGITVSDK